MLSHRQDAQYTRVPVCAITLMGTEHDGELKPISTGCTHEHVQNLFGCQAHRDALPQMEARGAAWRCPDCGHACLFMVLADGRVYRFGRELEKT